MNEDVAIMIVDPSATEALFGDTKIAMHLYGILHGTLQEDHRQLLVECHALQYETAKSLIHRIKGSLRYCKAPEYEHHLLALEEDIIQGISLADALHALEHVYQKLYAVLDAMLAE